jgi:5'-3' exonuclease
MSKLNMIMDFNNFCMRSLFTCKFMDPDVHINNFNTQREIDILVRKIVTDMCWVIRTFSPNRVIVSCDAKSPWRKDLYKDIDGMEYKGTREKDDEKNWDNIFKAMDDLRSILKDKGFIVTYLDHTEADDITTMWKEYIFDKKEDVILVSSDMDWVQLVGKHDDNICVCYNPIVNNKGKKRLYINQEIQDWINTEEKTDIFFTNFNGTRKIMKNVQLSDPKITFEMIDPERVLLNKIMAGDLSDNVPSFWHYYRNGRKQNVTELKAKHVFEALNINTVDDLIESNNKMMLKDALEKEMKRDIDVDFTERIDRQRKLVELKSSLFPDKIVNAFNKIVDSDFDTCTVNTSTVKMEDVLFGTQYLTKKPEKSGKLNSIFDDIDSLSKYSTNSKSLF